MSMPPTNTARAFSSKNNIFLSKSSILQCARKLETVLAKAYCQFKMSGQTFQDNLGTDNDDSIGEGFKFDAIKTTPETLFDAFGLIVQQLGNCNLAFFTAKSPCDLATRQRICCISCRSKMGQLLKHCHVVHLQS